ncbi:MAG: galactokinase [Cyclobacteriaceae bacterium]|nr:galactokinase [Cyclobacteriaceae bacterium]
MLSEEIKNKFTSTFNKNPLVVRSPGRINMIGEHTDYNEGYVMPAAIDKQIVCAISANYNHKCKIIAYDLDDSFEFDITNFKKSDKGWPNYILGVIEQFQKRGMEIRGFDCVFGGDIPLGAGLSSSAAMECAFAFSFNLLYEHNLPKLEIVKLSQAAENEFVGVKCGIMDQFASVHGKVDQIFRLDCKTLEFEYFNFVLDEYRLVLCDTQVKHSLASSEYNTRRNECEEGVAILQKRYKNIHSLRDVTIEVLTKHESEINPVTFKRCKYIVEENARVIDCCDLLQKGDLIGFGENMFQTHEGLSNDYEVSCKELDFLAAKAKESNMVIGARMMGGGFGGCTINIVKIERLDQFINYMTDAYKNELNRELKTYVVKIENGTSKL